MSRQHRSDEPPISKVGARAREQLLEAAGEVFAEKGFQGATSREICVRAGANIAAVNYHFGGFDALYIATLKEAHRRADWIGAVDVEGFEEMPPKDKLRAIVRHMVGRLAQSTADSWEMRLVGQELIIPTFAQSEFIATSIEPKRAVLRAVVADIIECPPDDPRVGRCMLTVIAPCFMMSIISRSALETFLPDLDGQRDGVTSLIGHIERFVLAGLDAVARGDPATGANPT